MSDLVLTRPKVSLAHQLSDFMLSRRDSPYSLTQTDENRVCLDEFGIVARGAQHLRARQIRVHVGQMRLGFNDSHAVNASHKR